jgi:hypothetical protein
MFYDLEASSLELSITIIIMSIVQLTGNCAMVINYATRGVIYNRNTIIVQATGTLFNICQ